MGTSKGLTPEQVRRAFIEAGGNHRAAARALGVTDATIRHHLRHAATISARVTITPAPGTSPEDAEAIMVAVRATLDRAGVTRPPASPALTERALQTLDRPTPPPTPDSPDEWERVPLED